MSSLPTLPDPDEPNSPFIDREFLYAVVVAPAAFSNVLAMGMATGAGPSHLGEVFVAIVSTLGSGVVSRWRDTRWKVLTVRRRRKSPSLAHIVGVEFLDTCDEAEARRLEILSGWVPGSRGGDQVIKVRKARAMRKM